MHAKVTGEIGTSINGDYIFGRRDQKNVHITKVRPREKKEIIPSVGAD